MVPDYGHHLKSAGMSSGKPSSLIYAVGDIHGSLQKLRKLIVLCKQHAAGRPMAVVLLGDYIDRGPESADVIRTVIELQSELGDRVVALKGNHEAMALAVIDGKAASHYWFAQGGAETLRSYAAKSIRDLPPDHVEWLRSLPLSYDDGRRLFVHAGIDPQKPLETQHEQDLLWIREPFLSDQRDHGRLIVHGHTPLTTGMPELRKNRLNLDTGAVFGGPLTAAVFLDSEVKPIGILQAK
jgi:serine/threonine protein phosphatase 1